MVGMVQCLRFGRNMGRKLCGFLMVFAVVSVFWKMSFLSSREESDGRRRENNGIFILQTFKEDWSSAQRVVTEDQATSIPKRILERIPVPEIWRTPNSEGYHQRIAHPRNQIRKPSKTNGCLIVHANGGLNQMRTGICDMVAVAKIMNATLVPPCLDHESFRSGPRLATTEGRCFLC